MGGKQNDEERMRDEINKLSGICGELVEGQKQILTCLKGDKDLGHTGLIHRVDEHGKKLEKHEKLVLWGGGFIVAAGILWDVIKEKIKNSL